MTKRQQQDARHREAVRAYYDTRNEALLGPVLAELRPRLVDFLLSKNLHDAERREDLVQEALAESLIGLRKQQFKFAGSVASWAMSISWYCFTNSLNRKKDWITQPGQDEDPFLLLSATLATPAEECSQEDERNAGAVVAAVTHAVLNLDASASACVLMYYYQGLPEAMAAAKLGIAESQFKARLRRGLTSLREWGTRHAHLAPGADLYAALVRVNSGDLFREPSLLVG
jgi:RNA polymerase sigma factor (sigma-70 family)